MEHTDKFEYTYRAPQNNEIAEILEKYLPREETKLERLRRLDKSSTQKGLTCSLTLGIAGSLLLGLGMCCAILWGKDLMFPGVLVGLFGIAGMAFAYPLSVSITKKERERLAPEILKLTSELLDGQA